MPEAFEEVRRRDVPILLSVGYSACHWCRVMAEESFADPATAAQLNEGFVAIKIDRDDLFTYGVRSLPAERRVVAAVPGTCLLPWTGP